MKTSKGFSILELMVALGLITLVSYIFVGGIMNLKKLENKSNVKSNEDRQVAELVENLRSNINSYMVVQDYQLSTGDAILQSDNLPLAWNQEVITDAESCVNCPGRLGYIIQPFDGFKGLYQVTVKITHRDWQKPREVFLVLTGN